METTVKLFTAPGESDPQGPAGDRSTVPAPSPSSSYVGLKQQDIAPPPPIATAVEGVGGVPSIRVAPGGLSWRVAAGPSGIASGAVPSRFRGGEQSRSDAERRAILRERGVRNKRRVTSPLHSDKGDPSWSPPSDSPSDSEPRRKTVGHRTCISPSPPIDVIDFEEREDARDSDEPVRDTGGSSPPEKVARTGKRGRPPKNPLHAGQFTKAQMRRKEQEKRERAWRVVEEEVADPGVPATSKRSERAESTSRRLFAKWREAPTASITQEALDAVVAIRKVADKSPNIKGALLGELYWATEALQAANMLLSARAQEKRGEEGERLALEQEAHETEMSQLRACNARLQKQNEALKAQAAQGPIPQAEAPKPPPASREEEAKGRPRTRRKRRAVNRVVPDTSSDETVEMEGGRNSSPTPSEKGRVARREVAEDLLRGTLPPAIRPPILGRTAVIKDGG